MTDNNDNTLYEFAIIGPVGAWNEGDVTADYWGKASESPLTREAIGQLIECFSENTPVTWEESIRGVRGTFESYEHGEWNTYAVVLDEVTPARLAELAESGDPEVREVVAAYPNTPPEVLVQLAQDESAWVRRQVAKNPSTPPEVLANLANDPAPAVAQAVAQNPNTPDVSAVWGAL
jgi:hypothetical protein